MNGAVPHSSRCLPGILVCRDNFTFTRLGIITEVFLEIQVVGMSIDNTPRYELFTKRHGVTSQKTSVFSFSDECHCVVILIVRK
jgi:hypothetical protein